MVEGAVLCLCILGAIMFGLLVGVTAIFGKEVDDFEGGSVETVKVREPSEDVVDGEDDPNCVLATDEDFSDTDNGEFRYIEGAGLYMCILGAIMFGLFVGVFVGVTAIYGGGVDAFEGGLVETVKVREPSEDVVDGEDDPNCVLAADEDFSGTVNGEVRYIGSSDCVKIPHVIKDEEMTSYHKITDMSYMFNSIQDTEVDLSNFNNTSNVMDLSYMFNSIQDTEVDLSNFNNTSNVMDLSYMLEVKTQS